MSYDAKAEARRLALRIGDDRGSLDIQTRAIAAALRSAFRAGIESAARIVEGMGDCAACDLAAEIRHAGEERGE